MNDAGIRGGEGFMSQPFMMIRSDSTQHIQPDCNAPHFHEIRLIFAGGQQYHTSMSLLARITINPAQCGGRPCIRGMRIRVKDILDLLAAGVAPETILQDYP